MVATKKKNGSADGVAERVDRGAVENLTFRLIVLMNLIVRPFDATFGARHNIILSEWRCMMWLAANPGASGEDTATGTGMDRMSVSRNLRSLEKKGYTMRSTDPADRKRRQWRLTGSGWKVYDHIRPAANARDGELVAAMSAEERRIFTELLDGGIARFRESATK